MRNNNKRKKTTTKRSHDAVSEKRTYTQRLQTHHGSGLLRFECADRYSETRPFVAPRRPLPATGAEDNVRNGHL